MKRKTLQKFIENNPVHQKALLGIRDGENVASITVPVGYTLIARKGYRFSGGDKPPHQLHKRIVDTLDEAVAVSKTVIYCECEDCVAFRRIIARYEAEENIEK